MLDSLADSPCCDVSVDSVLFASTFNLNVLIQFACKVLKRGDSPVCCLVVYLVAPGQHRDRSGEHRTSDFALASHCVALLSIVHET
jgi:hypothetical protein